MQVKVRRSESLRIWRDERATDSEIDAEKDALIVVVVCSSRCYFDSNVGRCFDVSIIRFVNHCCTGRVRTAKRSQSDSASTRMRRSQGVSRRESKLQSACPSFSFG